MYCAALNKHFWYRLQPEGPYVHSQRNNKALGFSCGRLHLSQDNGRAWPQGTAFADAGNMTFSCILENGNILFATPGKIYLNTNNLRSYRQITIKDVDGSDCVPHTSENPADIANLEKHALLHNPQYECANMIIQDGWSLAPGTTGGIAFPASDPACIGPPTTARLRCRYW